MANEFPDCMGRYSPKKACNGWIRAGEESCILCQQISKGELDCILFAERWEEKGG